MPDIRLDPDEMALWNEPGSRGDAFRRATLDRAAEEERKTQKMVEVIDRDADVVRATESKGDQDPEAPPKDHA